MVLWVILRASNMSGGGVICPFPCCPTTGGFYGSHLNSQNLLNIFPNFADVWSGSFESLIFFKVFVRFRADRWSVGFRADTFERDWREKESTNKPADDKNVSINHNGPRDWVAYLWFVQNFVNPQFDHHTFSSKFGEKDHFWSWLFTASENDIRSIPNAHVAKMVFSTNKKVRKR